jgi:SSS family solute:Na+ symporter
LFVAPNWLHYEIILFFIVIASMIVISMVTKPSDAVLIKGLTIGSASPEQRLEVRNSYNHWDVINSLIIIAITLAFYAYFW